MYTDTDLDINSGTYARARTHTRTYVCMYVCMYICICIYIPKYTYNYISIYICIYIHMYIHLHTYAYMQICMSTHTHTWPCMSIYTQYSIITKCACDVCCLHWSGARSGLVTRETPEAQAQDLLGEVAGTSDV